MQLKAIAGFHRSYYFIISYQVYVSRTGYVFTVIILSRKNVNCFLEVQKHIRNSSSVNISFWEFGMICKIGEV
jgi:hypothetical protein